MRIEGYQVPESSFLSVEKDTELLVQKIFSNERLKKLLYYTVKNPLDQPKLTDKQTQELFKKNIKIVPKLYIDGKVLNYLFMRFVDFSLNDNNPEFRDNYIELDIVCHFSQWDLGDYKLRPYRIAAELDSMLDKKRLTGIGRLEFCGARQVIMSDEYAGVCMLYKAIHGGEDKKFLLNPDEDEQFVEDFKEMIRKQKC